MPRKKLADPTVEWKVYIPQSVAAKLELLLMDPVTGRPRYGARGALLTTLIRNYLATRAVPPKDLDT